MEAGQKLKATLVWTDFPGASLINDLDLIVRHNDFERHGNTSPSSEDFDRTNNVEQVRWTNLSKGKVQIIIRAYRTPIHPQNFALVLRVES